MNSVIVLACLLLCGVLGGCAAGPLRLGQLPTDEERCVNGGGVFHAGLCDYCR